MAIGRIPEDPERLKRFLLEHSPPCPRCGYSLEGLESRVCPECGQPLSVAAFMRARRKKTALPGWLHGYATAAAFAVCVLVAAFILPLPTFLPVAALVVLVSYGLAFGGWYWWAHRR